MSKLRLSFWNVGRTSVFANCGLPYYIGGVIQDEGKLLVATAELFTTCYNIDVSAENEVLDINRADKTVSVRRRHDGTEYELTYDALVLSPRAKPLRPPLPGIDLPGIFSIRTVPDSRAVRAWIDQKDVKRAVVIGGGFIGIEMAENLHHRGIHVTLLELAPQIMPPFDADLAMLLQQRMEENGLTVCTGEAATSFAEGEHGLSVTTNLENTIDCDLVILAIGVQPEGTLASAADLPVGPRGHIIVNSRMRTEDPAIYAIGDAVQQPMLF